MTTQKSVKHVSNFYILGLLLLFYFFISSYLLSSTNNQDLTCLNRLRNIFSLRIKKCLKKPQYKNFRVGIHITSLNEDEVLYQRNPQLLLIPASAIKIFVSGVALFKLGINYQFITPFKTDGKINPPFLNGNLYIVGKGDPSIMLSHIESAAKQIKKLGIREIQGDLIYDISFLDQEAPRYLTNARHLYTPPCAITVNYNCIDIGIKDGPPPLLWTIPKTSYAKLYYRVNISKSNLPNIPKMRFKKEQWRDYYSIIGTVNNWNKKYKTLRLCVSRPGLFFSILFKEALQKEGIKINGNIHKGITSKNAKPLIKIKAAKLFEIIQFLNYESNNVVAETINKVLGANFDSLPGTRKKGLNFIYKFCIQKIGFQKGEFNIVDTSGLSPNNRFSARQFTRALNFFYYKLGEYFVKILLPQGHHPHAMYPVPKNGTRVFVKSGTLPVTGVNSLVGYIFLDNNGKALSFSIIFNRKKKGSPIYSGTLTNPILSAILESIEQYQASLENSEYKAR